MTALFSALLYFTKDLLKAACLIVIGRDVFGYPQRRRRILSGVLLALLAAPAALAAAPLGWREENRRMLADTLSFLLCVGLPLAFSQAPRRKLAAFFCAALLLDFTADTLYSLAASIGKDAVWWESAFGVLFYSLLPACLLLAGKRGDIGVLRGAFQTIPKGVWAALLFFEFTCYYRTFGEALSWYNAFTAVAVLSVLLTLFYLIFRLLRSAEQQNDLLGRLAAQKDYGERLQRSDEELRAFRHDYRNHLIVVRSYLESGDVEAAKAYFDGIAALSEPSRGKVSTGNFAADAIISYKLRAAEQQGVRFCFEGCIPPEGIRDEDLCTILSNLLDNAVEAAAPLAGEKDVHIEAVSKNGFLLLCVTNPTGNAPKKRKNDPSGAPGGRESSGKSGGSRTSALPATTKSDKKNHGYGLKNVKKTVQKYGGSFTVDAGEQTFSANVRIKL